MGQVVTSWATAGACAGATRKAARLVVKPSLSSASYEPDGSTPDWMFFRAWMRAP